VCKRKIDSSYPVHVRKAKHIVDGDEDILADLLSTFLEHLPEQMQFIQEAVENGDGDSLKFYTHQLKGGLRNFAADEASTTASALEAAGAKREFQEARHVLSELRQEVEILKKYIKNNAWKEFF
jgi:HPt (histidine-containing phosphotransfer) domain-containing protein